MEVVGAGDSGVETECDLESSDSSLSGLSGMQEVVVAGAEGGAAASAAGAAAEAEVAVAEVVASDAEECSRPSSPPLPLVPAPEDGYLGDCSSDGGPEKHFPLPPDWAAPGLEEEPLPGLQWSGLAPLPGSQGYSVLPSAPRQGALRTKVRSTGFRSRYNRQVEGDWGRVKAAIAERKLRLAANTNNTEMLERLLEGSQVSSWILSLDIV